MMRAMLIVVLVGFATVADAKPASLPFIQCKPGKGTPIFEARWKSGGKANVVTKVFASGQWTRTFTKIKMKAQATCAGVSADSTDIYPGGKLRFTEKLCSAITLDTDSNQIIETIAALIPSGLSDQRTLEDQLK